MKHTKHLSILIVAMLMSTIAFGQKHQQQGKRPTKEKIKAMKISYITSELDLSPKEAQVFWPIYNEFEAKMEGFHKERRAEHKKHKTEGELSDKEYRAEHSFKRDLLKKMRVKKGGPNELNIPSPPPTH